MQTINIITFVVTLCFLARDTFAFVLVHQAPRNVTKVLTVDNGGQWGTWRDPHFCAEGAFAVGYDMKIESDSASDDTGMNGIRLECHFKSNGHFGGTVESGVAPSGDWLGLTRCDSGLGVEHFLVSFSLQVEAETTDDTAANYAKFMCRDFAGVSSPYEIVHKPGHGYWGTWGSFSEFCDPDSAICGISTKIEDVTWDHTGLNDARFYCCPF
ncbi:VMO1-like protein [Mya arenaria]|uniref:VMO1-like protein n=1 Tax=Mya arenaria TaxID=6604 RepID=A0ABY7D977_MYAAR|nr:vitelline membrane outer layer protein 1-like [Mya arenaria]WAQ93843.1 VMO1-like protein [Mya arenaria]